MHRPLSNPILKAGIGFILTFALVVTSCAPAVYKDFSMGSVIYLSTSDNNSIVHLEVQGAGLLANRRKFDASSNALRSLLLQGVSGSIVCEYPLASAENRKAAERELEKLMNSGSYVRFITYITEKQMSGRVPDPVTKGYTSRRQKTYAVGINYVDLRRHFENVGAIRKFGL
jgi:hypothetical protein